MNMHTAHIFRDSTIILKYSFFQSLSKQSGSVMGGELDGRLKKGSCKASGDEPWGQTWEEGHCCTGRSLERNYTWCRDKLSFLHIQGNIGRCIQNVMK